MKRLLIGVAGLVVVLTAFACTKPRIDDTDEESDSDGEGATGDGSHGEGSSGDGDRDGEADGSVEGGVEGDGDGSTNGDGEEGETPPSPGFRVALTWDVDGTDVDIHVLRGMPEMLLDRCYTDDDCYWARCSEGLDWGTDDQDIYLELDDLDGLGPELVRMDSPAPGTYLIAAEYFSSGSASGSIAATMSLYIDGVLAREMTHTIDSPNDWWVAMRVDYPAGGGAPVIEPLDQELLDADCP